MSKISFEAIGGRGKGGDGLLTILKTLSYAALNKGLNVAYSSNYNPETRGSLVEGTTVISAGEIVSPVVESYSVVFAFDKKALEVYGRQLKPGALLIYNTSVISDGQPPEGCRPLGMPISDIAIKMGAPKLGNMVALAAYIQATGHFSINELVAGMKAYLPMWRQDLIPQNKAMLEAVLAIPLEDLRLGKVPKAA
ncbi:MAG: 2-oxoacid:acceptor oxidoreductase family protein [Deltaproteobacteria bacterium]|nr:2-oxoacid:acceptor oxidoreductase family protein [Deltaproteobacteria bacterium]